MRLLDASDPPDGSSICLGGGSQEARSTGRFIFSVFFALVNRVLRCPFCTLSISHGARAEMPVFRTIGPVVKAQPARLVAASIAVLLCLRC